MKFIFAKTHMRFPRYLNTKPQQGDNLHLKDFISVCLLHGHLLRAAAMCQPFLPALHECFFQHLLLTCLVSGPLNKIKALVHKLICMSGFNWTEPVCIQHTRGRWFQNLPLLGHSADGESEDKLQLD